MLVSLLFAIERVLSNYIQSPFDLLKIFGASLSIVAPTFRMLLAEFVLREIIASVKHFTGGLLAR